MGLAGARWGWVELDGSRWSTAGLYGAICGPVWSSIGLGGARWGWVELIELNGAVWS